MENKHNKRNLIFCILLGALILAALVICIGESAQATYDIDISARQGNV